MTRFLKQLSPFKVAPGTFEPGIKIPQQPPVNAWRDFKMGPSANVNNPNRIPFNVSPYRPPNRPQNPWQSTTKKAREFGNNRNIRTPKPMPTNRPPAKPLRFPSPTPRPRPPFGTLPKPPLPVPVRPPFRLPMPFVPRFLPWLGWALTAWDLYQLYKWWFSPAYLGAPAGWTVKCSIAGDRVAHARAVNLAANVCNTPGQVYAVPMWPPVFEWVVGAFSQGYKDIAIGKLTNGGLRFSFDEIWDAPSFPLPANVPTVNPSPWQPTIPSPNPVSPPEIWPELDPFAPLPLAPAPQPQPLPPSLPKFPTPPDRSPDEWHRRGPRPSAPPKGPGIEPFPESWIPRKTPIKPGWPGTRPTTEPEPETEGRPRGRPRPRPRPNWPNENKPKISVNPKPHARARPRKRDREKKWSTAISRSWLTKLLNYTTESKDFIEALFMGLPERIRNNYKKNPPPQLMLEAIYDNLDSFVLGDFMVALIENQIEDLLVGKTISKAQKAALKHGINPGALTW